MTMMTPKPANDLNRKKWKIDVPTACRLCDKPITNSFVNGKRQDGRWSHMCLFCHREHGVGFGDLMGQLWERRGQEFIRVEPDDSNGE